MECTKHMETTQRQRLAETSAKLVALFETEKYERQIEVKDQIF